MQRVENEAQGPFPSGEESESVEDARLFPPANRLTHWDKSEIGAVFGYLK